MVEEIKSQEKVSEPVLSQSAPPKHTQDEHVRCAFYPKTEPFDHFSLFVGMQCPHEVEAAGAFYSEDYVRELRLAGQAIVREWMVDPNRPIKRIPERTFKRLRDLVK